MGLFGMPEGHKIKSIKLNPANASDMIYYRYRNLLRSAAVTIFDWQDAPETANMIYFENCLLDKTKAAFYVPLKTDFILSSAYVNQKGKWNAYGIPTGIVGLTSDVRHMRIRTDDFEVCYDNVLAYGSGGAGAIYCGTQEIIDNYAQLLWECENTFRSNLMHQNKPFILEHNTNTKMSWAQFWEFFQDFKPYILAEKGAKVEEDIKTLDLKVDFKGQEILACKEAIWSMAMNALGYSAGTTKKERELYHEVMMNRMADGAQLNARLAPRIDFCNRVNRHWKDGGINGFNADMSVNLRSDPIVDLMDAEGELRKDD